MSFGVVRLGDEATKITLSFRDDENTLENVQRTTTVASVTREIQTKSDFLKGTTRTKDLGRATSHWEYFSYKREPRQISKNISGFDPVPQKIDKFGMTSSRYGDEVFLTEAMTKQSMVSFEKVIMAEMESGFVRLDLRNRLAAMVNPVRWMYQEKWQTWGTTTGTIELPNSRIVAVVTATPPSHEKSRAVGSALAGATGTGPFYLAIIDNIALTKIMRKFYDNNVPRSVMPYATLSPNMQEQLYRIPEFSNKFSTFQQSNVEAENFPWRRIRWQSCTPEIMPGAFYSDKRFDVSKLGNMSKTDGSVAIVEATDTAQGAGVVSLTSENHEVIPMWVGENIYKVTSKTMDKSYKVIKIPHLRDVPILYTEKNLGGCRKENLVQLNLCVPYIA